VQASDGTLSSSSDFTIGISHPNATAFVATDPVNSGLDSLFVYGTDGKDSIKVALVAGQYQVTINKVVVGTFPPPTGGLYVYGAMGDDTIDVGSTTTLNAFIDGGLGNDKISGGLGNDVILGRDGKDSLAGRGGKDVIIGGLGADSITADGTGATSLNEGNILIGDSTDYDADLAALAAISAAWIGNNTATVDTYLSSATVHGDGLTDTVKHTKLGIDWFYAFELNSKGGRLDKLSVGTGDIVK
ncbi:MAG TPA: hypothetical protein VGE52_19845, partial [Pirellulales bacterium]